jgi:hypothetical protein
MPIHPIEPNSQESDDDIQRKLRSEQASAMMEEVTFEDDEIAGLISDGRDQALLGERYAPPLLTADVNLPANAGMSLTQAGEELGRLVERQARESLANAIVDDDLDEYVWIPLAASTIEKKKRENKPAPTTPLYGTGLLVQNMARGWVSKYTWNDTTLSIEWGPTAQDDLNPSMKYHDMFFGNPGTGKGRKTVIPRRFPRLLASDKQRIMLQIQDWIRMNTEQPMLANSSPRRTVQSGRWNINDSDL